MTKSLLGTCSFKDGSQFSSLLCSNWVLISTGWLGCVSTSDLVVYRDRSISQTWGRPRMTVMGRCKHHSSSWGENASCQWGKNVKFFNENLIFFKHWMSTKNNPVYILFQFQRFIYTNFFVKLLIFKDTIKSSYFIPKVKWLTDQSNGSI